MVRLCPEVCARLVEYCPLAKNVDCIHLDLAKSDGQEGMFVLMKKIGSFGNRHINIEKTDDDA